MTDGENGSYKLPFLCFSGLFICYSGDERKLMEDTKIITMPVIALRGLTMLPEMTMQL